MIILEGVDGAGKSSLSQRLRAEYNHDNYTHYSKHEPAKMLYHAMLGKLGPMEIVDRFHLSEIPYSMYLRHETPDYDTVFHIERECRKHKHLLILCNPPYSIIEHNWSKRKTEEVVKNEATLRAIHTWYNLKLQAYSLDNYLTYDYTFNSFDTLIGEINDYFE